MIEFDQYDRAPWFWFYVALTIAADVCEDPDMSVKNPTRNEYPFDLYQTFEDAIERYNNHYGWRKEKYLWDK